MIRPAGLRSATRSLLRAPAFTLGVVVTLGLGIGVTSAAYSLVRAVLLRPLPHRDGDRLVYVRQSAPGAGIDNVLFSVPEIVEYREGVAAFADVAEFSTMRFAALDLDEPREVHVGIVTGNYFGVMGLGTILGRPLGPADDPETADPVAVLTVSAWRSLFGEDPDVVGRAFRMNGRTVTVVGVAEPHPPYPERTDMYVNMVTSPHHLGASMNHDRTHRMTEVFARLESGARLESARDQVAAVAARGREGHPEAYDPGYAFAVRVTTLKDQMSRRARMVLIILGTTALLVLVVALANVANLVLARASRLSDELAVRASLGATAVDLRGRLMAENLVLGGAASLAGLAVCVAATGLLAEYLRRFSVRASEVSLDVPVLVATLGLGLGASVLLTFLPRVRVARVPGVGSRGGPRRGGSSMGRTRVAMVSAQVAVSLVLVFAAGVLSRTLIALQTVDTGLPADEVLALDVPAVADGRSPAEIASRYRAMLDRIEALPHVGRAALTNAVPMRTEGLILPWVVDFVVDGREREPGAPTDRADFRVVSEGYFETLEMDLLAGRTLASSDDGVAPPVVVVNRAWADRFLGGGDALGLRLRWTSDFTRFIGVADRWFTVVGVVENVRERAPDRPAAPAAFIPFRQASFAESILVRFSGDAQVVADAVKGAVRSVAPDQPVENVATLAALGTRSLGEVRLNALLVTLLAAMSLAIAAVGLFAALAFSVSRRRREVGVRMALGADPARVVRGVVREGMGMTLVGIGVGMAAAQAAAGFLERLVRGVPAADPWTLLAGAAVLLTVSLLATALPAWRAARVDPAGVLGDG